MTLRITPATLAEWLTRYQNGCRIVSVTMLCPLKMNKTHRTTKEPNPYLLGEESTIDHLSERVVLVGADYAKMINKAWSENLSPRSDGYIPVFTAEALWKGAGHHINRYLAEHTAKQCLYLCCLYAKVRGEDGWIERSLTRETWLDRITGEEITPDWEALAPYLPPKPADSIKQGCRDGSDVVLDVEGETYIIPGGINSKQVQVRMPHLENVLQLRSFDLRKRGSYEVVEVSRSKYQTSV